MNHPKQRSSARKKMSSHRRAGYVLLMSLVILCLAALVLSGLARHSFRLAVETLDESDELQLRWGSLSLRRTLALRAPGLYDFYVNGPIEQRQHPTTPFPLLAEIILAKQRFAVTLEDENTKLNLNRLYAFGGKERVLRAITSLSPGAHRVQLRLNDPSKGLFGQQPLDSFGQVFDLSQLGASEQPEAWIPEATKHLTLWGNGRLNVLFTPEEVLKATFSTRLSAQALSKFFELRKAKDATVAGILKQMELKESERTELTRWLSDRSFSFLIRLAAASGERVWHEEFVTSGTEAWPIAFVW
jgi:hypothetical protein